MKRAAPGRLRLKLVVRGAVQGVGFRPFVFRLATGLQLAGRVNNSPQGVFIEVEGPRATLEKFLLRLEVEKPPRSFIQSLEASWLDAVGFKEFEIRESEAGGDKTALVLPDIATCPDCLREIFDPKNRRYRYPFTNCTNCGPRFSIIESLPYDRVNTSMKSFTMCPQCRAEYDDPRDRRFHAQPNACHVCGPHLELWKSRAGVPPAPDRRDACPTLRLPRDYDALHAAAGAICEGKIVAVKGLGGFHLLVDARNDKAVRLLRKRKHREEKPFALMFPSLGGIKAECEVSLLEERLLRSPESPIILLKKIVNPKSQIVNAVAPGNPNLGAMLPYTPLHHLLMAELGFPVVATSGNLSDEPICTDEHEAMERLGGIADVFLVHNRPIVRHVDDSIVRVMLERELVLRRARGFAPLPTHLRSADCGLRLVAREDSRLTKIPKPELRTPNSDVILAVGAHLKNTVALLIRNQVFISQHIGDLETEQAHAAFRRVIADFEKLYEAKPQIVAADLHPDYLSTRFAREIVAQASSPAGGAGCPQPAVGAMGTSHPTKYVGVQHHIAHVLSCMAENEITPPVLGVSWDGTGYGLDGTVWGGEFFLVAGKSIERIAHLRPFRLPGGEKAVKEPRRTALGLLYEISGDKVFKQKKLAPMAAFSAAEIGALKTMLAKKLNSPPTSSMGRLFDAVASLVNLRQHIRFEGQAAMELEFALEGIKTDEAYELRIADCRLRNAARGDTRPTKTPNSELRTPNSGIVLDWSSMIEAILADVKAGVSAGLISAKFHNALVEGIVAVAKRVGQNRVVLSGGCFQNRYLTERAVRRLQAEGFRPYWHQRVPPNDGGIALGQVVAALRANG
jgi:hydrogenase maturation protein HypF